MKSKLLKVQIGDNIIECQQETTLTVNTCFEKQQEPVYEMNLKDSFEYLGISEHFKSAWNSSSTGELFFLQDYIVIANFMKQTGYKDVPKFTKWFNDTVDYAYKHWERPISIYQHIMNPENFK